MRTAILLVVIGTLSTLGCSSSTPLPSVTFGPVQDVLSGEEGPALDIIGGLPAVFLVGESTQFDQLIAARAAQAQEASPAAVLIACRGMNDLDFTAFSDRAFDAALDDGGNILLDRKGSTASSLRQGSQEALQVSVDKDGAIAAVRAL